MYAAMFNFAHTKKILATNLSAKEIVSVSEIIAGSDLLDEMSAKAGVSSDGFNGVTILKDGEIVLNGALVEGSIEWIDWRFSFDPSINTLFN